MMQLHIERDDDGSFIISDDVFGMYGTGDNLPAALRDYAQTLVEYGELLAASAAHAASAQALLDRLHQHVGRI